MEITKSSIFMNCRMAALVSLLVLGVTAGAVSLLWWAMSQVGPDTARIWALVATLIIVPAGLLGYRLGHVEARGRMAGIDDGISRVMQAAGGAIDLRASAASSMKRVMQDPDVVVDLPPADGSYRLLEPQAASNVIEME